MGITAGCAFVSPAAAVVIGAVAGLLLAPGSALLERFCIDDAVGAIPVHGFAGLWGTVAVGLFHETQGLLTGGGPQLLAVQALGAAAVFAYSFTVCLLIFAVVNATVGLRVSREEELSGLDIEHGARAYPDFQPAAVHAYTGDD